MTKVCMARLPFKDGQSIWGPMDAADEKALKGCDEIIFELVKKRNPKFHRKAFALFGLVLENQDKYDTIDTLMTEIKLQLGHYEEHVTLGGKLIYKPKSIAFDQMDENDFNEFMQNAINVILKFFCIGMDREILERIAGF